MKRNILLALVTVVALGGQANAQVTPPPASPTLWSFLGIPQGMQKVKGAMWNRRGNHPALEPKPATKALADVANLESPVPAIKKAAEVKQAEDLAPQKIKAVKYLAETGCGCYDLDDSITGALVEATKDCTETVRLATVQAVELAASGKCCSQCGTSCCCKEAMVKRLAAMAYERDETGCYLEPSERVREAARRALCACCPGAEPVTVVEELPDSTPNNEPPTPEGGQPTPPQPEEAQETAQRLRAAAAIAVIQLQSPAADESNIAPVIDAEQPVSSAEGVAVAVSSEHGRAQVHLADPQQRVPLGTVVTIYPAAGTNYPSLGTAEVVETFPGSIHIAVLPGTRPAALTRGVIISQQPAREAPMPVQVTLPPVVSR
ncbi:MAG: hypothetical protein U0795_20800 [Pirellulales bacterium]